MTDWIGPAIGAVGKFFGGRSRRAERRAEERAYERSRPVNQRKEWEDAGFNPSVMMTGGAYYQPPVTAPIGDPWDDIGDIVSGAVEQRRRERLEETGVRQENKELRDRLKEIARQGEPSYMQQHGAAIPLPSQGDTDERVRPAYQSITRDGARDDVDSRNIGADRLVEVKREEAIEGLTMGGMQVRPVEYMSDAEMIEQRYGDVISWGYGLAVGGADAKAAWDEQVLRPAYSAVGDWWVDGEAEREKRRDERQEKPSFNNLEFGISPLPRVGGGALPPSFEHFLQ